MRLLWWACTLPQLLASVCPAFVELSSLQSKLGYLRVDDSVHAIISSIFSQYVSDIGFSLVLSSHNMQNLSPAVLQQRQTDWQMTNTQGLPLQQKCVNSSAADRLRVEIVSQSAYVTGAYLVDVDSASVAVSAICSNYLHSSWPGDHCSGVVSATSLSSEDWLGESVTHFAIPILDHDNAPAGQGRVVGALIITLPSAMTLREPHLITAKKWAMVTLRVMAAFCLGCIVWALYLLIRFRNHPVLKISSVYFRAIILLGVSLTVCSTFAAAADVTDTSCSATLWLLQQGFALCMGTMSLITFRIYYLMMQAQKLNRNAGVGNQTLLLFAFLIVAINSGFLASWQYFDPPTAVILDAGDSRYYICSLFTKGLFMKTLLFIDSMVMLSCIAFAWKGRGVILPGFSYASDSMEIFIASYNVTLICCVFFPVLALFQGDPTISQGFLALFGLLLGFALFLTIFSKRFMTLYRFPDGDDYLKKLHQPTSVAYKLEGALQFRYFRSLSDSEVLVWVQEEPTHIVLDALRGELKWLEQGQQIVYRSKHPRESQRKQSSPSRVSQGRISLGNPINLNDSNGTSLGDSRMNTFVEYTTFGSSSMNNHPLLPFLAAPALPERKLSGGTSADSLPRVPVDVPVTLSKVPKLIEGESSGDHEPLSASRCIAPLEEEEGEGLDGLAATISNRINSASRNITALDNLPDMQTSTSALELSSSSSSGSGKTTGNDTAVQKSQSLSSLAGWSWDTEKQKLSPSRLAPPVRSSTVVRGLPAFPVEDKPHPSSHSRTESAPSELANIYSLPLTRGRGGRDATATTVATATGTREAGPETLPQNALSRGISRVLELHRATRSVSRSPSNNTRRVSHNPNEALEINEFALS
eukprot:gb/GEZN01001654.1/.p1 GENE.gb/GEZN01001654.1/~~gb/GEZN01001654.1/.p1  ORF type:complete len:870 (-),score=78.39 gb/GEZN01001654.1/:209-2818(-)